MRHRRARAALAATAITALAVGLSGCFNPFAPRLASGLGVSKPKPVPNSPAGVMELFQWCWENRAIAEYRELFSDDFVFRFALADSAGDAYKERPWTREDELISAQNLFVGGGQEEPATSISLQFNNALRALNDTRPGKDPAWHRQLTIDVVLTVTRPSGQFEVKGANIYYVVRGDSARIPAELGFGPDPDRWYIERWEDETVQSGAFAVAHPSGEGPGAAAGAVAARAPRTAAPAAWDPVVRTFGQLKKRFR
jgi:hypothetical protein